MNDPDAGVVFLARHLQHVGEVQSALLALRQELERRADRHDRSKLGPEELAGFVRLAAPAAPYGTEAYKESIRAERPTVEAHYRNNSHHPQHHESPAEMGWLDLIEMVFDWWGAAATRPGGDFGVSMKLGIEGHAWTPEQVWLIREVGGWIEDRMREARR